MIISLQEGNKVMQQQIDLLNQELREAKQQADRAEAERANLAAKLDALEGKNRKLSTEAQRVAEQMAHLGQSLQVDDKGGTSEDIAQPLSVVVKAAEEALSRNGYSIRVGVKTDQKAVYITERKVSTPISLEMAGFRNQYLVSFHALPPNHTRISVKADFERMTQGNRVLTAGDEETSEVERRLITEISKAMAAPAKVEARAR